MRRDACTIALTGQALFGRSVARPPAEDPVARRLRAADAAFCNFEGTMAPPSGGVPMKNKTIHTAPPDAFSTLAAYGITHVSLANNHGFDLGPAGVVETRHVAEIAGIGAAGAGVDATAAARPAVAGRNNRSVAVIAFDLGPQPDVFYALDDTGAGARPGLNPLRCRKRLEAAPPLYEELGRIAEATGHRAWLAARAEAGYGPALSDDRIDFFGLTVRPGRETRQLVEPDEDDVARAIDVIGAAKTAGHVVVVSLHQHHWGADFSVAPDWILPLSARLIAAGADLIACHGNPRVHRLALIEGKAVFTGLGNFVFHTRRAARYSDPAVWRGMVATCRLGADGRLRALDIAAFPVPDLSCESGPQGMAATAQTDDLLLDLIGAAPERVGIEIVRSSDGTLQCMFA